MLLGGCLWLAVPAQLIKTAWPSWLCGGSTLHTAAGPGPDWCWYLQEYKQAKHKHYAKYQHCENCIPPPADRPPRSRCLQVSIDGITGGLSRDKETSARPGWWIWSISHNSTSKESEQSQALRSWIALRWEERVLYWTEVRASLFSVSLFQAELYLIGGLTGWKGVSLF